MWYIGVLLVCANQNVIDDDNALVACNSQSAECTVSIASPFYGSFALIMQRCDTDVNVDLCNGDDCLCAHIQGDARDGGNRCEDGTLIVNRARQKFRLELQDTAFNNYIAQGQLDSWSAWHPPSRVLSLVRHGARRHLTADEENSGYYSNSYLSGLRRDCNQEKCPTQWENCFPAHTGGTMLQIRVLVFLEKTFCANFSRLAICFQYVEGLFRDANLLFERQVGVHLVMAFVIPPDVVDKHFPLISNPESKDAEKYLHSLDVYFMNQQTCETKPVFKAITGFEHSQFGLVHVFTNVGLEAENSNGQTTKGFGTLNALCSCKGKGAWSSYQGDLVGHTTWHTFAHEIGHNFGARHYWESAGLPKGSTGTFGIMDYGDGTFNGIFQFHDKHKNAVCGAISSALEDPDKSAQPGCFRPFYAPPELDERTAFDFSATITALVCSLIAVVLLSVIAICFFLKLRTFRLKYEKLGQELNKTRASTGESTVRVVTHDGDTDSLRTGAVLRLGGSGSRRWSAAQLEETGEVDSDQSAAHLLSSNPGRPHTSSWPTQGTDRDNSIYFVNGDPGPREESPFIRRGAQRSPPQQDSSSRRQHDGIQNRPKPVNVNPGDAKRPHFPRQEQASKNSDPSHLSLPPTNGLNASYPAAQSPKRSPKNHRDWSSAQEAQVIVALNTDDNSKPSKDPKPARQPPPTRSALPSPDQSPQTRPAPQSPRRPPESQHGLQPTPDQSPQTRPAPQSPRRPPESQRGLQPTPGQERPSPRNFDKSRRPKPASENRNSPLPPQG